MGVVRKRLLFHGRYDIYHSRHYVIKVFGAIADGWRNPRQIVSHDLEVGNSKPMLFVDMLHDVSGDNALRGLKEVH